MNWPSETPSTNRVSHRFRVNTEERTAVEDDALRRSVPGRLFLGHLAVFHVHREDVLAHRFELLNHLLTRSLNSACGDVLGSVGVDVGDEGGEGRATIGARGGVDDLGGRLVRNESRREG